jgi:hypothetical protein
VCGGEAPAEAHGETSGAFDRPVDSRLVAESRYTGEGAHGSYQKEMLDLVEPEGAGEGRDGRHAAPTHDGAGGQQRHR